MSIFSEGLRKGHTRLGDTYSICQQCRNKALEDNQKLPYQVEKELKGSFSGIRMAVIEASGEEILICPDCLKGIYLS